MKVANLVCKAVGIAGASAVIYDAYALAKHHAKAGAEKSSADLFERSIAAQRTSSTGNETSIAMQKAVADFRISNPIIPFFGTIKGFCAGFLSSLGNNIVPTTLSAIAMAGKGMFQKFGAWGLGAYGLYLVVKEGFGVGKTTPMD